MPTRTARPRTGPELLQLISETLGHTPTHAIALLATHLPVGLTGHRITPTGDAARDADTLLATLDQLPTAAAVVLAAYVDSDWWEAPHSDLQRIRTRLELAGYPVRETLLSTGLYWGHPGEEPSPLPRHPAGQPTPRELRDAFHTAYRYATARTLHRDGSGRPPVDELISNALTRPDLPALAALAAALGDPLRRPEILHCLAWGSTPATDPLQLLEQQPTTAPDPARLELAEILLRTLSDLARERRVRAGALGLLGWVLAAQGRGTAALGAVDHALSVDPDDVLAGDLRSWLDGGHLPPWCRPGRGERR